VLLPESEEALAARAILFFPDALVSPG